MSELLVFIKTHLFKLLSLAFLYLAPIHVMMLLIGVGIIADTIAGRWAAKKIALREGKDVRLAVTSRKTRNGLVSKLLAYQAVIISLFILDKYMLNDLVLYFLPTFPIEFAITKIIGVILLLVEADSIDEKYYVVTGKRVRDIVMEKIKKIKNTIIGIKTFKKEIEDKK